MQQTAVGPAWTVADRLRKVRREVAGMSQQQFAGVLGVNPATYAAWEGGRARPRGEVGKRVARRLERLYRGTVTAAWVLGFDPGVDTPDGEGDWIALAEQSWLPRLDSNQQPSDCRRHRKSCNRHDPYAAA